MAEPEAPAAPRPPRLDDAPEQLVPPRLNELVDIEALRPNPKPAPELGSQLAQLSHEIKQMVSAGVAAAVADPDLEGMGTTTTAGFVDAGVLYLVHVGDSRAYLVRDGRMVQVTDDHSIVAEMVRRGALSEADAEHHPARHVITRALGVDIDVEVDALRVDLEPGDVVLLCTDGLSGPVDDDEILAAIDGAGTLNDAAATLIALANDAGGPDNVTVVLARVDAVTREAAAAG